MIKRIKNYIKKHFVKKEFHPVYIPVTEGEILKGKIALITGGSDGIGFGIAKAFVKQGAKVIITGRNREKLVKAVENLGDNSRYVVWDASNIENISKNVEMCADIFGTIDILVNNAGYHGNQNFFTVTEDDFDKTFDVNLKSVFFLSQAVGQFMINNGIEGHILNISSGASNKPAWSPYEISKWAVRGFTLGLARELIPYNIIVNGIGPGPIATSMSHWQDGKPINWTNPAKRLGMPQEIGNLAVFLCSELGKYIVGDTVFCDGGAATITSNK